MDKATWTQAYVNNLPDSAFLYVESGDKDGEGKTVPRSNRHLPYKNAEGAVDLPHLRNAISRLGQPATGGGEDNWLTEGRRQQLLSRARRILQSQGKSLWGRVVDSLKQLAPWFDTEETKPRTNRFMVWKEQSGEWRWLAIYSNKFRDNDTPAEILSEQAHKDFVAAVDRGEWPYPELWLWHVPGTKCGAADFVAYDDHGFALSSGTVDDEAVAQKLAADEDLLVSHGMPRPEIQRDAADPTILTRYRTKEISPLASMAAANKLTGWVILGEEHMALPKEKRDWLVDKLGEQAVAELEKDLGMKAKTADALGLEYKDTSEQASDATTETEKAEASDADAAEADASDSGTEAHAPAPDYATREEVAEAIAQTVAPILQQVESLAELTGAVEELTTAVKALQRSEDERLTEMIQTTPAASLTALTQQRLGSVIGRDETRVDGRTKEAKAGPQETPVPANGPTFVPYINNMIARTARRE